MVIYHLAMACLQNLSSADFTSAAMSCEILVIAKSKVIPQKAGDKK